MKDPPHPLTPLTVDSQAPSWTWWIIAFFFFLCFFTISKQMDECIIPRLRQTPRRVRPVADPPVSHSHKSEPPFHLLLSNCFLNIGLFPRVRGAKWQPKWFEYLSECIWWGELQMKLFKRFECRYLTWIQLYLRLIYLHLKIRVVNTSNKGVSMSFFTKPP